MGKISHGCNSSFITLDLKIKYPTTLRDYRPISLICCIYKVIAKIIANRLKEVIGIIIDKVQFAYITGRSILDVPLVINDIYTWEKKNPKKCFLFKVDFEIMFKTVN